MSEETSETVTQGHGEGGGSTYVPALMYIIEWQGTDKLPINTSI